MQAKAPSNYRVRDHTYVAGLPLHETASGSSWGHGPQTPLSCGFRPELSFRPGIRTLGPGYRSQRKSLQREFQVSAMRDRGRVKTHTATRDHRIDARANDKGKSKSKRRPCRRAQRSEKARSASR